MLTEGPPTQPREPQWDKPALSGPAIWGCVALVAVVAASGGGLWLLRSGHLPVLFDRGAATPTPTIEAPTMIETPTIEAPTPTPESSLLSADQIEKSIDEQFRQRTREMEAGLKRQRVPASSSGAAAPADIRRVGGGVESPKVISRVQPVYPEAARLARIQGVVIVEAVIDERGDVARVRVLKGLPMGLDTAAVDAVRRWKFAPATFDGRPVAVYFLLTVNFKLE